MLHLYGLVPVASKHDMKGKRAPSPPFFLEILVIGYKGIENAAMCTHFVHQTTAFPVPPSPVPGPFFGYSSLVATVRGRTWPGDNDWNMPVGGGARRSFVEVAFIED